MPSLVVALPMPSLSTPTNKVRGAFPMVRVLLGLVIVVGIGLRLAALLGERSLWIDEAMLALNIVQRSPAELFQPLAHNQGAPIGYLLAVKLCVSLFGSTEIALRLVSFLGSLASLVLFSAIAYRILPLPAARLALVLFCISPTLISYSAECKQYSTDATVALGLLWLGLPLFQETRLRRHWLRLAVGGAFAVWCSHPAVFVLAAIGSVLWTRDMIARQRTDLLWSSATIATWLLSFTALYFLNLKEVGQNSYLRKYWEEFFLHWPPRDLGDVTWVFPKLNEFFAYPGGFRGPFERASIAAALFAGLGIVLMLRERTSRWLAILLVLPFDFVLAASALQKYPFGGRLLLFLVPFVLLVVARGVASVFTAGTSRWFRGAGVVSVIAVITLPLWDTISQLKQPPRYEEIRPLLQIVQDDWQTGDRIYVYNGIGDAGAGPAFEFYRSQYRIPQESIILGGIHRDDTAKYEPEVLRVAATPGRVWFLFIHRHGKDQHLIWSHCHKIGTIVREVSRPGAALVLVEFSQ